MTEELSAELTFQAALHRYLLEVSSRLSPQSQARDERLASMLIKRLGGERSLASITPLVLSEYREKRLKDASAATVEKDFVFLSALFERAMGVWQMAGQANPVSSLGSTARTHGRDRRLRPGERVRLLAACDKHPNPMLGWVVRLGLETAMRKSEILTLKQEDIDLKKRIAVVPKNQTKAPRPVPLTQKAVHIFQEIFAQKDRPTDTPLLFYGELGRFETRRPYAIDRVFRQLLLTARMKAFRFSDLRFEAISYLREVGLSELEIIALAGTRGIRGRRRPEQQPEALVKRLDALGVGVIKGKGGESAVGVRRRPKPEEAVKPALKRGSGRRGGRGSFGVPVGVGKR
ncbi:MAG: site-specific integrase [Magnetococcales bacterium]|nr:site-specific integrase [Magnetococcales bacterium]